MNVFIFSNAFVAKNLAFELNWLLNQPVSTIYVLEENHSQSDFVNSKIPVVVHNDIGFCIENSDLIIIVVDNNVPKTNVEKVTEKVNENGKHIIIINNPWVQYDYSSFSFSKKDMMNLPVVCVFGIGYISQLFCTELLLNDIFEEENTVLNQIFTPETKYLLEKIWEQGFLNDRLKKQLEKKNVTGDLVIMSFYADDADNSTLLKYRELIKELSPDYIILQTQNDAEAIRTKKIFEKSTCINVDLLIKSNFISYDNKPVYMPTSPKNEETYIESPIVSELIKRKILSKIAFPVEMRVF